MQSWRAALRLAVVVAALCAPVIAARSAQEPPPATAPNRKLVGMATLEGKQVPLPPGVWTVAGHAAASIERSVPARTVVSLALVRLNGNAVEAAVLIQTNKLDTEAAWGKAGFCDRTDLYFAAVRYASDHDSSCAYAAYVEPSARPDAIDPAWKQAFFTGVESGWRFPARWVEAAYRITDPRDALQVRYLFDPSGSAGSQIPSAAVASLVNWTQANWYAVGSGFRNRLANETEGLPDLERDGSKPRTARAAIAIDSETSNVQHLGIKMLTYRAFGTLTDMTVNYLWLGSLPSAGGLAAVGAVASSSLYFVHELVWSRFERPLALIGELPGLGVEGPGPGRS